MKTRFFKTILFPLLTSMCVLALFAGCASLDASNQESLLAAAGFRARTPQTPKQQELYAATPAYKVQQGTIDGKIFYAYKDEKKGVAWVGGEAEYQKYQQLAIQQNISQNYYQAAQMNDDIAWRWRGAWGPGVMVWR